MSSRPQFIDQEAKAREDKARYDHANRFPQTPEDAAALLAENGYGAPEALRAAADGTGSALALPAEENLRKPNERHALGVLMAHGKASARQPPWEAPKLTLPSPADPLLTARHILDMGVLAVDQFAKAYPDDWARLKRQESERMSRSPVQSWR